MCTPGMGRMAGPTGDATVLGCLTLMGLRFRLHTDDDVPALARFWSKHSGWIRLSAKNWADRFTGFPEGPTYAVIGEDEDSGEMLAQMIYVPLAVHVRGRRVRAYRSLAPIVARSARGRFFSLDPNDHPVIAMSNFASKALIERENVPLTYAIPDIRWLPFFRLFPNFRCAVFPLRVYHLHGRKPPALPDGYTYAGISASDPRIDRLWARASQLYEAMLVRDARSLPGKVAYGVFFAGVSHLLGVERDGDLVGLANVLHMKERCVLHDMLTADADEALRATLAAAVDLTSVLKQGEKKPQHHKLVMLSTPLMDAQAFPLGFEPCPGYDTMLLVNTYDPDRLGGKVLPDDWYISLND